jgi:hypothetical protein
MLAPILEEQDLQRGELQQSDVQEDISMKTDSKLTIEHTIREGTINWMEYAARSEWWASSDCAEVLLNYIDMEGDEEDSRMLKKGVVQQDGLETDNVGLAQKKKLDGLGR